MRWVIVAVLLVACAHPQAPASASATSAGPPPPVAGEEQAVPSDLDAEVRRVRATALFLIASLGETIAAALTLRSSGATLDPDVLAVLTLPTPWARGWDVLFIAERPGGGVSVVYEGRHADGASRSFQRLDNPRPLVGIEVEAWAARQLAADRYHRNGTGPAVQALSPQRVEEQRALVRDVREDSHLVLGEDR